MTDCGTDNTDDLQWEAYLLGVPDPPIHSKESLRSSIRMKKQENKMPKFWKKWNTSGAMKKLKQS